MSSARRTFLKHAGLSAAAFAALPATSQANSFETNAAARDGNAARVLDAYLEFAQQQETWDTSWAKRIKGKHRAMFDVPEVEGGVGVLRSGIWQRQYNEVLKPKKGDMTSVMVIRHNGIHLAMNQDFWTTYNVGEEEKLKGDDGKPLKFNPVLPAPGADTPASFAALMLDKQIEGGAIVLACNLAYRAVVGLVQRKDKLTPAEARTKADSMLVPGVIMQPSGIFANVMAQQAGCVFVQAV
jgi:hypothetical protein